MILVTMKTDGFILAVIDDFDIGVIWEVGFAFGISFGKLPVVTYTDKNYGLNAMLVESAIAHIRGEDQLRRFLREYVYGGINSHSLKNAAIDYQNFDGEIK